MSHGQSGRSHSSSTGGSDEEGDSWASGNPHITYYDQSGKDLVPASRDGSDTDQKTVKLAIWDGSIWKTETVVDAQPADLGQLVVMKLDSKDRPHIAYFEVTNNRKLDGVVKYAVGTPR